MCGITGYYSFHKSISSTNILEMNQAIRHRGPDDEGFWMYSNGEGASFSGNDSTQKIKEQFPVLKEKNSNIALGFRRLSIIDLSEKGHQPMLSKNEQIIITFNGEIYNFKKLRKELESLGHSFCSTSDTEVILKAYQEWGSSTFAKLDGMFAVCIVDLISQKLILARDRVGMKPLFYHHSKEGMIWGSEIKALLKNQLVKAEINWNGVYTNFLFQTTLAPQTCFQNIFSLEPASFMTIDLKNQKITTEKFWRLPSQSEKNISDEEAVKRIDELLSESISEQLYADVPVAVMMSGGIDSTLIASKSKSFSAHVNTYTISYPFSEEEVHNASLAARHFGIPHEIKKVNDDEALEDLKENIQHFEEPYSSFEVLINAAKYAHNQNFKVVLSGNGADELFAGYSHTLKLNRWLLMRNFNFIGPLIFTKDKFSQRVKNYFSQDHMFDFFRQSQISMRPMEVKSLITPAIYSKIDLHLSEYHLSEGKNYAGYFEYDMKYSLSSHHVFRDDLSAMKYSVEFRYPYLSNNLIDYVSSLPENIRFNGIQNKPLLRKAAKKYLPQEILNMPKKGFSFPVNYFIKNEQKVRDFITENLESLKKRNFFNAAVIDEWWNYQEHEYDWVKIWQLVTFELWYQKYFEK
ncbi:asparagine synthase (glutamine-hydrolyzing) [Chryseobacterium sp. SG20098]|uniref:asparagine synthase (glutamine-hydrolyzing) n=1 Tax=Chryseobacterium sp. SG20098 TaxID=3074145 RepID=UPI00288342AB|nr:asparagine synthase (glutamine-hydrolyzing) [Chryseobacterium sp. SG20098]WNI35054.1 asparagine synthase (glutamine-hydrolyzing) [Chryseobacterium sp. SG20098]